MSDVWITPFCVYGYVFEPGDIHIVSYLDFLHCKFASYSGVDVFCMCEAIPVSERKDVVCDPTIVVGFVPPNDLLHLNEWSKKLTDILRKEGMLPEPLPRFVVGVDLTDLEMMEASDSEPESDLESDYASDSD